MPKRLSEEVKDEARRLRADGISVRKIALRLGISKSTVSRVVRDIELTPAQRSALDEAAAGARANISRRAGQVAWSRQNRNLRWSFQDVGRRLARDEDFAAGAMLYWAEGTKSRNTVALANTDPDLIAFFVAWLRRWFPLEAHRLTLSVNCFLNNGLELHQIEAWWIDRQALDPGALRKAAVNRPGGGSKGVHRRHLYGTATVTLNSTAVLQAIYGAIQEVAGIERPEWLDMGTPAAA